SSSEAFLTVLPPAKLRNRILWRPHSAITCAKPAPTSCKSPTAAGRSACCRRCRSPISSIAFAPCSTATGRPMVPNIPRNGRSFRGAGAYHLHDKPTDADPRPRTGVRVAFTATRNLANEDPRAALDEMWRTADDARHLKAWAGLAPSGRKSEAPVKTVSLAWAPGERPTEEEMCRAADSFMKAMGWGGHQAVYVAHNDTRHVHLHLIINRVHPDSGRALNDWQ